MLSGFSILIRLELVPSNITSPIMANDTVSHCVGSVIVGVERLFSVRLFRVIDVEP
jgi:hypothetical protein